MAKDLFGFEDTRTKEEKEIAEELDSLLRKYRLKYGMDVDLSPELSYYNDDYDY